MLWFECTQSGGCPELRSAFVTTSVDDLARYIEKDLAEPMVAVLLVDCRPAFEIRVVNQGRLAATIDVYAFLSARYRRKTHSFADREAMQALGDATRDDLARTGEPGWSTHLDHDALAQALPRLAPPLAPSGAPVVFDDPALPPTLPWGASNDGLPVSRASEESTPATRAARPEVPRSAGPAPVPGEIGLVPLDKVPRKSTAQRPTASQVSGLHEVRRWAGGFATGFLKETKPPRAYRLVVHDGTSRHATGFVFKDPSYVAAMAPPGGRPWVYAADYHGHELWRVDASTGESELVLSLPRQESGISHLVALATGDVVLVAGWITWLAPTPGGKLSVVARCAILARCIGSLLEGRVLVVEDMDVDETILWVLARDGDVLRALARLEVADGYLEAEPGLDAHVALDKTQRYAFGGVTEAMANLARYPSAPLAET